MQRICRDISVACNTVATLDLFSYPTNSCIDLYIQINYLYTCQFPLILQMDYSPFVNRLNNSNKLEGCSLQSFIFYHLISFKFNLFLVHNYSYLFN
jgi:hypothetical protein